MTSAKPSRAATARERTAAARMEFSVADFREVQRRIKDMRDPTRYMIVSAFSPQMILYYDVSSDTFCSEPDIRTTFKRKAHADAIAQLLNDVQVVEAKVLKDKQVKTISRIRFPFPNRGGLGRRKQ